MENILPTDSVFDRLVKVLDTNCGYVDEEKVEIVAERLVRSGLIDVRPVVRGEWTFDPLSGDWICSVCDLHSMEHGHFCPNCGADMRP